MTRLQKGEGFPGQQIVVLPKSVVADALQQPVLRELLPTDVGYFPNAAGHLRERPIGVPQVIIIYCAEGAGWVELNGQRRLVAAGELLIIPANVAHAYGADKTTPWSIFWLHAAGNNTRQCLTELGISAEHPLFFLGQNARVIALFEEMIEVMEQGYSPSHLIYSSRTLAHLFGLLVWQRQQKWQTVEEPGRNLAQTIAYMKNHLNQPLRVPHLAAMASLSVSHYSARFKRHTGYSPIDYFIRLRMQQACQLLDNSVMSIKQIAACLGYEDQFYFSRVFKSLHEISPSQYRMQHKG